MTAPKRHTNREFFNFFRSRLSDLSAETASKYSRTISDLDCFLTGHRLSLSDLSPAMVADWATELFRQGLAVNTVVRHLNILSALIVRCKKRPAYPRRFTPPTRKIFSGQKNSTFKIQHSKFPRFSGLKTTTVLWIPGLKTPRFSGRKKFKIPIGFARNPEEAVGLRRI